MEIKEFIIHNKSTIVKWIGVLVAGVLGITFLFGGSVVTNKEQESSKIHLLCIGVDKFETMGEREKVYNSIGQADGIFLITIDEDKGAIDIVAVPRDTMVTIQKYYANMDYMGEEEAQICLQYAYADGMENSCALMVDRVEEIFDGVKIDGYVAINMSSVVEINQVVGGVTVTVNNEDTAEKMGIETGSSIHLTNENISLYLQSRDKEESQSAYGRMDRMKDYINAFLPQAKEVVKEKPEIVGNIATVLGENMVTDLSFIEIAELAGFFTEISMEDVEYHILEGNVELGPDGYEEFYPDMDKLNEIIEYIK